MASTYGTSRADSFTSRITIRRTRMRTVGSKRRASATARSSVLQQGLDDHGEPKHAADDQDQPESQLGALEPRGDREEQTQRHRKGPPRFGPEQSNAEQQGSGDRERRAEP